MGLGTPAGARYWLRLECADGFFIFDRSCSMDAVRSVSLVSVLRICNFGAVECARPLPTRNRFAPLHRQRLAALRAAPCLY